MTVKKASVRFINPSHFGYSGARGVKAGAGMFSAYNIA